MMNKLHLMCITVNFLRWGLIATCLVRTAICAEECPPGNNFDHVGMAKVFKDQIIALYRTGQAVDAKVLVRQIDEPPKPVPLPTLPLAAGSFPALYAARCRSVLVVGSLVNCGKCKNLHDRPASGFVVAPDGIVATACHVVTSSNALILAAMDYDRKLYPVTAVLAADRRKDVAIIKVQGLTAPPLRFSAEHSVGSEVWVISHPADHFYLLTRGIVSGLFCEYLGGRPVNRMAITAEFGGGSSGAPVFNSRGEAVAMAISTHPITTEGSKAQPYVQMVIRNCLPAEDIIDLLRGNREP